MSMNVVQGNEQKHKTYWNRVGDYFHKEKSQKTSKFDHTANSVMNSQSLIQLCINKFVGCLASIEYSNPSGVNEQEKVKIVFK